MIVGVFTLDPKRIISSGYEIHSVINKNVIYTFAIQYLIGTSVDTKVQWGTLEECQKWTKLCNKYIGQDSLLDLISTKELEDVDDDDDEPKATVGFKEE